MPIEVIFKQHGIRAVRVAGSLSLWDFYSTATGYQVVRISVLTEYKSAALYLDEDCVSWLRSCPAGQRS
jgi:hypothetical protein